MATLRNTKKLAAHNWEDHEDHPGNFQGRNPKFLRIQEDCITQRSEKIEGRGTKYLSQEYSKTESRIFCPLLRLVDFFLNPQARIHSGPVREASRNLRKEIQATNKDRSPNDPHPEVGVSMSQSSNGLSPERTNGSSALMFEALRCKMLQAYVILDKEKDPDFGVDIPSGEHHCSEALSYFSSESAKSYNASSSSQHNTTI